MEARGAKVGCDCNVKCMISENPGTKALGAESQRRLISAGAEREEAKNVKDVLESNRLKPVADQT